MRIKENIKDVSVANTKIYKILSGGGILWEKAMVPGPTKLIGGNSQAGFYGEVPAKDFITGDELARRIGLTAGTSQYSNEPWLKFSYLGKVEFVAKKPFRCGISWDNINGVNAVFGNRTININGLIFKIRLLKGKTEGKQNDISAAWGTMMYNSEWNRLLLPVHKNSPSNWVYKNNVDSPTENWNIGYSDIDFAEKQWTICQEFGRSNKDCLLRGLNYITNTGYGELNNKIPVYAWRPVLELVD